MDIECQRVEILYGLNVNGNGDFEKEALERIIRNQLREQ